MAKTYTGTIFSGIGVATTRVSQNLALYRKETGTELIPGTLNVRLLEEFEVPPGNVYLPPEKVEPAEDKRGITLVPAHIRDERVCIIVPDSPIYDGDVIEIMASFNVREKFCLKDNDTIEVIID